MSTSIDQRVVEMQFDNVDFEKDVSESMSTLNKLKKALNLEGATKGLENIDSSTRRINFAPLNSAVDTLKNRFSALEIIAITTLANITNSAVNAGKNLISSLTIDPITTGLQEYETKMNAITTILTNTQSKGTTLDDVNATLQELNEYADKTIYNFAEMTRNIGTFTAAGIGLDESATAIKGIANLAAGSGSNAQQASNAMYQLSQELAAGRLSLMGWNSVVNAGMGGELFQNALKDTAKSMGIFVDESTPFRETLQTGWVTSDVLIKTLEGFASNETLVAAATEVKTFTQLIDTMKESVQSGWAVSWEHIIGDREQATEVLTAVNNAFGDLVGPSAEARNAMLQFWNENGGRDAIIKSISNAFNGLMSILNPISDAFKEIFPPTTGQQLTDISNQILEFTEKISISEETINDIKNTFKGFFAVLDIFKTVITTIVKSVLPTFFESFTSGAGGIFKVTGAIGEYLVTLNEMIKSSGFFEKLSSDIKTALDKITNVVSIVATNIKSLFSEIFQIDLSGLGDVGEDFAKRFQPFEKVAELLSSFYNNLSKTSGFIFEVLSDLTTGVKNIIRGFLDSFSTGGYSGTLDLLNTGIFASIILAIKKFLGEFEDVLGSAGGFMDNITGILDGVKGSLQGYQDSLKAGTLLKIASAIGILAASLMVISIIDSDKLSSALGAMAILFTELFTSLAIFDKTMGGFKVGGLVTLSLGLIGISNAILILSFALKNIASLSMDQINTGLYGLAGMLAMLIGSSYALSNVSGPMIRLSISLTIFSVALEKFTEVIGQMSNLSYDEIKRGLAGVAGALTALSLFLNLTKLDSMSMFKGLGILALAGALSVMADAVKKISMLDPDKMTQGLIGLAVILTQISLFLNTTGNVSHVISTAIGLTILGGALNIFALAIERLGSLSVKELIKGLGSMGAILTMLAISLNFMPKNLVGIGIGLTGVAGAITIMSVALKLIGGMSWEELSKGLIGLAGGLSIMAVTLTAMTGTLAGSAALVVLSGALAIFIPTLMLLGQMSWSSLGIALITLASSFGLIAGAAVLLTPVVPALYAFAGALGLIGLAVVGVGAGILALSAGLAALAVSGTAGLAVLTVGLTQIIGLIPYVIQQIGNGLVLIAETLITAAPTIAKAVTTIIFEVIKLVEDNLPQIIKFIKTTLTQLLDLLVEMVPKITDAGLKIIIGFLRGLEQNIEDVVDAGVDTALAFISGVGEKIPDIINAAFELIIDFVDGLAEAIEENIPRLGASIGKLAGSIIDGLVQGLLNGINEVASAAIDLAAGALDSIKEFLGIHSPSRVMRDEVGNMIVQGIAEGITSDMSAEEAAAQKASNIVSAFQTELDKLDLVGDTFDLETQLWSATNINASELDKSNAELDLLQNKLALQSQKVELAKGEYENMSTTLGEDSDSTMESYQRYLQTQIDLAELTNEINELQSSQYEIQKQSNADVLDKQKKHVEYLQQNAETLSKFGFSQEEIDSAARKEAGLEDLPKEMSLNTPEYENVGASYVNALSDGVTSNKEIVNDSVNDLNDTTISTLTSSENEWGKTATSFIDTFIDGIKSKIEEASSIASTLAKSVSNAVNDNLKLSPEITNTITTNVQSSQKDLNSSTGSSSGGLLTSSTTNSPYVPVVNFDEIQNGVSNLTSSLSGGLTSVLNGLKTSISLAGTVASSVSSKKEPTSTTIENYNFTQNNSSPKALDQSEIYRETNSLFNSVKEAVKN